MKLYIAKRYYDYEGFEILGIFDNKEKAQEVCDNDFQILLDGSKFTFGDDHRVVEYNLNEEVNKDSVNEG